MKKTLIVLGCMSLGWVHAQSNPAPQKVETNLQKRVGINTEAPQASMEIKEVLNDGNPADARIQGLSLPNLTTEQRSKFGEGQTESMKIGTLIYNTTKKCIEMYLGYYDGAHQWSCDLSGGALASNTNGGGSNTTPGDKNPNYGVVSSGFQGIFKQGQELRAYVVFTLKNNTLSPYTNLDLSKAVTLENGGTIKVSDGQYTRVTLQPGDDMVLKYEVRGTVTTGTLVAKFNAEPNLRAEQSKEIFPVGVCRRPTYQCGRYILQEMSLDECKADSELPNKQYDTWKWFLDGELKWELVKPEFKGTVAC